MTRTKALSSLKTAFALFVTTMVASAALVAPSNAVQTSKKIIAVGAENEYANVIAQIGGIYVNTSSILNNPSTDPHTFEVSPSIAKVISSAQLIVQNGIGYDPFMKSLESANANKSRKVIVVQNLLGLPDSTRNPHLWYDPNTMPKVAAAIAASLSAIDPIHASYYAQQLILFNKTLSPWVNEITNLKKKYSTISVAVTEPVADYVLTALGLNILTPWAFQADIMSGSDPSPELVTQQNGFFTKHLAKVFVYNQQVISPTTVSLLALAKKTKIPVVGVYETMPTDGYNYQTWMLAEVKAIEKALSNNVSTEKL